MTETLMAVSCAVLPERGEDSFALGQDEHSAYLCVADGCGGLGSKRYELLGGCTGAYAASRLATRVFSRWVQSSMQLPADPASGRRLCAEMEEMFAKAFRDFAARFCAEERSRIAGSMQRTLPAVFCAACIHQSDVCFAWAGDSRGYVLDRQGLHQCTQDHLRPEMDAFESLYRDAPLASLISADQKPVISMRRLRLSQPCVVLTATDGGYSSLLTPMEFEFLLLDTLHSAQSWSSWEKKLSNRLQKMAQDDATLLLKPCGTECFEELKTLLEERRTELQKQFVTPVRRHRKDAAYAREKWKVYRTNYDWTEGGSHERMDWRV